MTYEVGDKVVIMEGGRWSNSDSNPHGVIGFVFHPSGDGWYQVKWSNTECNSYEAGDLKVLGNSGMSREEVLQWWKDLGGVLI
jgi:hypothetical protein